MTFSVQTAIAVGSGGFFGAVLRYYVGTLTFKHFPDALPLATLAVNLLGSFLIGLLMAIFMSFELPSYLKLFLITGFLGALTTYSTFAIETYFLLGNHVLYGVLNIVANLVGSIGMAAIGYRLMIGIIK